MPEWVKWFFDGLGTQVLTLIVTVLISGGAGYFIGKHKNKFIQKQEAGSMADQCQLGKTKSQKDSTATKDQQNIFCQQQKAGDNSKQVQIGGQDDA